MSQETQKDQLQNDNSNNKETIFNLERTYVKDISLECPNSPEFFLTTEQPEVEMKISISSKQIEENFYDSSITATVTATIADEKTLFLVEVVQSGIFHIENIDAETTDIILNVTCPNILFPYLREVVSSIVTRAGFPPVILNPINFDALYQQQIEKTGKA